MVQWLRLQAPSAQGPGLIPGRGTRSHVLQVKIWLSQLGPGTAKYLVFKKEKKKVKIMNILPVLHECVELVEYAILGIESRAHVFSSTSDI